MGHKILKNNKTNKKSMEKDNMFSKCGGAGNVYGKATFANDKSKPGQGAFSGDPKKSKARKEATQGRLNHDNGQVATKDAHQKGIENQVRNQKAAQKKADKR